MGKGNKLYRFACKAGSSTVKKYHPECTKTHYIETQNQPFFSGEGTPRPTPFGAFDASILAPNGPRLRRRLRCLVFPQLACTVLN